MTPEEVKRDMEAEPAGPWEVFDGEIWLTEEHEPKDAYFYRRVICRVNANSGWPKYKDYPWAETARRIARLPELEAAYLAAQWQPIETAPKDGSSVLIFTTCHGVCEAWFAKGEWSDDTPISPAEYSGDAWICCDDAFQIEVEFGPEGFEHHGTATHWMPLPAPPESRK